MRYMSDNERKAVAADLKKIYQALGADRAEEIRDDVKEKCNVKYTNAMKSLIVNYGAITPIFKFSADVLSVIYTTNAIELNLTTGSSIGSAAYSQANRRCYKHCI